MGNKYESDKRERRRVKRAERQQWNQHEDPAEHCEHSYQRCTFSSSTDGIVEGPNASLCLKCNLLLLDYHPKPLEPVNEAGRPAQGGSPQDDPELNRPATPQ